MTAALPRGGAIVLGLVAGVLVGCGRGHATTRLRASFSDVNGASTSGARVDTPTADCTFDTVDQLLSCAGVEGIRGSGREVDVAIFGGVARGASYGYNAADLPHALVDFQDPPQQWNASDLSGALTVTAWDGQTVAFTFVASLRPVDATVESGSFTLTGDATIANVQTIR